MSDAPLGMAAPAAPPAPPPAVRVRFWGVRGSIPSPGPDTVRYGGNTSCVSLEAPTIDGSAPDKPGIAILDAGSGIRSLAMSLLRDKRLPVRAHLFLTHTHWDHIQGFPFFVPALIPGNHISVYGSVEGEDGVCGALSGQMEHRYFPIALKQMAATLDFHDLSHGEHALAGMGVTVAPLFHSSVTTGYRFDLGGRSVVYLTDAEPRRSDDQIVVDPVMLGLAAGSDVLIHDAQYTDEEYPAKIGWGHSPLGYVVDFAVAAGTKRLILFHHDPMSSDAKLDAYQDLARARAAGRVEVDAAYEGMEIALPFLVGKRAQVEGALVAAG
ncbi:MAG TPA: MBL fold metallo-hydrolase [Chloroflexota bacterium]|nr:MBL fold metallo-hydrolase [Chloroflexota bacterium]